MPGRISAPLSTHFDQRLYQRSRKIVANPARVESSPVYSVALKTVGAYVAMHLFNQGGHGYGLRKTGLPVAD